MDDYEPSLWMYDESLYPNGIDLAGNIDEIAKQIKISPILLDSLINFADGLQDVFGAIKEDMTDLYKEIKALKEQIK